MALIKGVHHVALKPTASEFPAAVRFYSEVLGQPVKMSWGDPDLPCMMISTGDNSCVEILPQTAADPMPVEGKFAHLALAADDVPACVEAVRAAGYTVTDEPKDVLLAGKPVCFAFCRGGAGEIVEFFCEK